MTSNETSHGILDLSNHDYLKICEENHNCETLQLKVKKIILIIEDATRLDIFGPHMFCQKLRKVHFPICS